MAELPADFDINGRPVTMAAAQREINRIVGDQGNISAFDEEQINRTVTSFQEDYRRRADETRGVLARYTKTVAEQLYSSQFRLIYELLQNADDAAYAASVEPTITYRIRPNELVVESNERGFSLQDVKAICHTGKSSKVDDTDTTGEKGLGFKSVFGIANRVHFQSGYWSFRFEHQRGNEGLGMITPLWTEVEKALPPGVGTRCRLQYSDPRQTFLLRLLAEFEQLPPTIIFALRQIDKIVVVIDNVNGRSDQITFTKAGNLGDDDMLITTAVNGRFGQHESTETRLRLFQRSFIDLPDERLRPADSTAVTLAFPIDERGLPIIQDQNVFAYLPVLSLPHLPFLIQADFLLTANRKNVPENDWNQALLRCVADLFSVAVGNFASPGDPLKYKWMRYLPIGPMAGFWEGLFRMIQIELESENIVETQRNELKRGKDVRILPSWFLHDKEPLLPDNDDDIYLSPNYQKRDIKILKKLGLKKMTVGKMLTRLQDSLGEKSPPIHKRPLDDPWHTSFVTFLGRLLQHDAANQDVQLLEIIPLNDGTWVSPESMEVSAVCFPYLVDEGSVKIELPEGLGLRKLHPAACVDGEHEAFYESLGVNECSPDDAIAEILHAHRTDQRKGTVEDFVRDSEILFWYWNPTLSNRLGATPHLDLRFRGSGNRRGGPGSTLYFPSDREYDAQQLLAATPPADFDNFAFLHPMYMESQVRNRIRHELNWLSWLRKCGVSHYAPLAKWTGQKWKLSAAMKLIARDNSARFVANLKEHSSDYQVRFSSVSQELGGVLVPCQDGLGRPLSRTILPTQQLVEKGRQLGVGHNLPFLQLPAPFDEQPLTLGDWSFLGDFGVICELNATFFLEALRLLKTSTDMDLTAFCLMAYAGIVECTKHAEATALQETFAAESLIWSGSDWYNSTQCVWEGPGFLHTVQVLCPVYGGDSNASLFFKTFLSLRNVAHEDVIEELVSRRGGPTPRHDDMSVIYTALAAMVHAAPVDTIESLRDAFRTKGLIFANDGWWRSSKCLWNCKIKISGRVPLETIYSGLRSFFVDQLRVVPMNINVLLQELAKLAKKSPPKSDEIKDIMIAVGQILGSDPSATFKTEHVESLEKVAFLPVRGPEGPGLASVGEDFFINDHKRYGEAFSDQVKILDFGYDDLTSLQPLFEELLVIEDRYLSYHVSVDTMVTSSSPSEELTDYIRDRAYALSCCGIANKSSKYLNKNTSVHQQLLNTKVFLCDELRTVLKVEQAEGDVSVTSERAVVKLEVVDAALHVYVPDDVDRLFSCFQAELPGKLAEHLGIEDRGVGKVIYRILNTDQLQELDTVLNDEDVPDYSWIEKAPPSRRAWERPPTPGTSRSSDSGESDPVSEGEDASSVLVTVETNESEQDEAEGHPVSTPGPIAEGPIWQWAPRIVQYKRLLEDVVRQAKRVPRPETEALSLAEIGEALDALQAAPDYTAIRQSLSNRGSEPLIGAAGELFVYERLKALGVVDISLAHWQSSIRHHVGILPAYRDQFQSHGRTNEVRSSRDEISDIMYDGRCARLQEFLRRNTSQPYPPWLASDVTPGAVHYHLEVKTTGGPRKAPFFMSQKQYELMRQKACDPKSQDAPRDLFVIVRVFNLFSASIGLQVYINPWHLRDGVLEFGADWKVVPRDGDVVGDGV